MIVGLDISTSCIGWCTLKDDGSYVDVGHIEFKKHNSLYTRLEVFRAFLEELFLESTESKLRFFIEAPLARSNNQNVVNLLQRWNGMCCAMVYEFFSGEPILVDQRSALKFLGIKVPKGVKGKDRKKYILQYIKDLKVIPDDKWDVKKTGNPKEWCFDQADAYVVARYGLNV